MYPSALVSLTHRTGTASSVELSIAMEGLLQIGSNMYDCGRGIRMDSTNNDYDTP